MKTFKSLISGVLTAAVITLCVNANASTSAINRINHKTMAQDTTKMDKMKMDKMDKKKMAKMKKNKMKMEKMKMDKMKKIHPRCNIHP